MYSTTSLEVNPGGAKAEFVCMTKNINISANILLIGACGESISLNTRSSCAPELDLILKTYNHFLIFDFHGLTQKVDSDFVC